MSLASLGARLQTLVRQHLDDVENAASAYLCGQPEATRLRNMDRYNDSNDRLNAAWLLVDGQLQTGSPATKLSVAQTWTQLYQDLRLYPRLRELLANVSTNAASVLQYGMHLQDAQQWRSAVCATQVYAQPAFGFLDRLLTAAIQLGDGPMGRNRLAEEVFQRLIKPELIETAAGAVRSITSFASHVASGMSFGALPWLVEDAVAAHPADLCGMGAIAGAQYALFGVQRLLLEFDDALGEGDALGALPEQLCRRLEAYASSGILPAVTAAIMDLPAVEPARQAALMQLHYASKDALKAIGIAHNLHMFLQAFEGERVASLARSFGHLLTHPDVRRLQDAALERLLLHAGFEDAPGFVSGSSGPPGWWLLREEARAWQLCGLGPEECPKELAGSHDESDHTAGWLEDLHYFTLQATLGVWRDGAPEHSTAGTSSAGHRPGAAATSSAGTSAVPPPPPRLVATLAARSAEALVRLCRGQGLHSAYAPKPEWLFFRTELMGVFDFLRLARTLPSSEARQCLPYWLEAAAWALALTAEAEAAGGPAAAAAAGVRSHSGLAMAERDDGQTRDLVQMLVTLAGLLDDPLHGAAAYDELTRAECAKRLERAGLTATLDHVVRLTFTAQDRGTPAAQVLASAPKMVADVLRSKVLSLLRPSPPEAAERPCNSGGDQLGLIITAAKRARVLATMLEASSVARSQTQRRLHREAVKCAGAVMHVLLAATSNMEGELCRRLEAARRRADPPAPGGGGSSSAAAASDPWDRADARCLSEAHEAFVLAARAACVLAAPLAACKAAEAETRRDDGGPTPTALTKEVVAQLSKWCRSPCLLPTAQLLACHPHRVVASACALLATVGPERTRTTRELGVAIAEGVEALAARTYVGDYMRDWLAPPLPGQAGGSGGGGADGDAASGALPTQAARGCLAKPLHAAALQLAHVTRPHAGYLIALLEAAVATDQLSQGPRIAPGSASGEALPAEAFQSVAQSLPALLQGLDELPGGSRASELLAQAQSAASAGLHATQVEAVPVLPPPLTLPATPAAALRRLRVCGNPGCANFARAAEIDLELKLCNGCKAVRYCGAECQRAHWRSAHRGECAGLKGTK